MQTTHQVQPICDPVPLFLQSSHPVTNQQPEQVQMNVKVTFNGLLEVIHRQNPGSNFVHAVLMFDELVTEKRLQWDPKTNYFFGICQEHADKTSTEFVNEEDMEVVFEGPVDATEKKTETGPNATGCNQTIGCGCISPERILVAGLKVWSN
jgi:hypothetical protein